MDEFRDSLNEFCDRMNEFRDRMNEFRDKFQERLSECRDSMDIFRDALHGDVFRDVFFDKIDEFKDDFHDRMDEFQDSMEEFLDKRMDELEDMADELSDTMDAEDSLRGEIPEETPFHQNGRGISISQANGKTILKLNGRAVYECEAPASVTFINGSLYVNGKSIPIRDDVRVTTNGSRPNTMVDPEVKPTISKIEEKDKGI